MGTTPTNSPSFVVGVAKGGARLGMESIENYALKIIENLKDSEEKNVLVSNGKLE